MYRRGRDSISSTPQLVSFATSPTTAELPFASPLTRKTNELYADDLLPNEVHDVVLQDDRQTETKESSRVDDSLSDMEMSDDELDVMSQATRASARSQRSKGVSTSTAVSSSPRISLPKVSSLGSDRKDAVAEIIPAILSLSPPAAQSDGRAISPLSPLSSADGDREPLQLPRFSSLPPSSPTRASTLVNTPQRARTQSPVNSQPQARVSDGILEGQHLLEEEDAPRRYSLRNRQPRQLNPYEYDKRMYKMQLSRIPEAIVKVVSPPKKPGEHGHGHKSREAEEDDFIAQDETEESQEQWLEKKHHRKRADGAHEVDNAKSDWMKKFELGDDELPPLPSPRKPTVPSDHDETVRRRRGKKPFSLEAEIRRNKPASEVERPSKGTHVAIAYGRRQVTGVDSMFRALPMLTAT